MVGLVIAEALYREYPDLDEGAKSKIRASLVSAGRLARLGEALGLGEHLLLGRGEEKTGGRRKTALLADACEAIVAAIYLDAGLAAAAEFVRRELWVPFEASGGGAAAVVGGFDYKSALQERLQARGLGLPEYRVAAESGPEHDKMFEVEVRGQRRRRRDRDGRNRRRTRSSRPLSARSRRSRERVQPRASARSDALAARPERPAATTC